MPTPLRPVDLPEARGELAQWYEKGRDKPYFETFVADEAAKYTPGGQVIGFGNLTEDAGQLIKWADLYWVEPDMMALAIDAAKSIPDFTLEADDLPSKIGLVYCPTPFWSVTGSEPWVGFMWALHSSGVTFSFLVDRHSLPRKSFQDEGAWFGQDLADVGHLPRLYERTGAALWPLGDPMSEVRESIEAHYGGESRQAGDPMLIMMAVWTLMQDRLVESEDAHLNRPTRRRLQRQQMDLARVRVLTLRRRTKASGDREPVMHREYHYQWIVDGHPRNQWFPGEGVHKRIWIEPYVKGPAGAPFLHGEKVHVWKR